MRLLLSLIAAALPLASAPARATDPVPPVVAAPSGDVALFVELVVNGEPRQTLVSLTQDRGHLWIDGATLRAAGIAVPDAGRVNLSAPPGFQARYDAPGQRLLLDVPPALLPTRNIALPDRARVATSVDTGLLVNYDMFVQRSAGATTAALRTEQRVFGSFGTLSNTGVLRTGFAGRNGYLRYDTRYHRAFEDAALDLTAGDIITRALPWTSAVRMGGIQLARNFAIRPDLITVPLPSFAGEARVPSGVELFVNGFRQASTTVEPGRFTLDNVPVVNGAGQARVVTTDAVGRQIATVIPFYVAPDLLRRGLTDFAVEAGFLRRGFGISNFGYHRPAASASGRHGLTDALTVSGHAEASDGLAGIGAGVAARLGLLGSVHGALSASRSAGRAGTQLAAGYTYNGRSFSIGAEHVSQSRDYADLGSFDLARLPRGGSSRSDRVSGSVILRGIGSLGFGYLDGRSVDGVRARLVSASMSLPIGRRASAFAAVDHDFDRGRTSMQLRVILPLGGGATVSSAGIARDPAGQARFTAAIGRATPVAGGLGFRAEATVAPDARSAGLAAATLRTRAVEVEAGASVAGTSASVWGGVSGSMVLLDQRLFAANRLPDAFALVSTGVANVPVSFENQSMGRTDRRGHLFVPSVTAYHANRFAIDPTDLPIGTVAPRIEQHTALRPGAGAVVRLTVRTSRSVVAHLVDTSGAPIAAGSTATIAGGAPLAIGWDGVVLIEDAAPEQTLRVAMRTGTCTATVRVAATTTLMADLGAVRCE
jgi:outer membrane usher protein